MMINHLYNDSLLYYLLHVLYQRLYLTTICPQHKIKYQHKHVIKSTTCSLYPLLHLTQCVSLSSFNYFSMKKKIF